MRRATSRVQPGRLAPVARCGAAPRPTAAPSRARAAGVASGEQGFGHWRASILRRCARPPCSTAAPHRCAACPASARCAAAGHGSGCAKPASGATPRRSRVASAAPSACPKACHLWRLPEASAAFRSRVAAVDYAHPWDELVRRFKFDAALDLADVLAQHPARRRAAQRASAARLAAARAAGRRAAARARLQPGLGTGPPRRPRPALCHRCAPAAAHEGHAAPVGPSAGHNAPPMCAARLRSSRGGDTNWRVAASPCSTT